MNKSSSTSKLMLFILFLLLMAEYSILQSNSFWVSAGFIGFTIIVIIWAYKKAAHGSMRFVVQFLRYFRADVLNWYGLFLVLYLAFQVTLLFDAVEQIFFNTYQVNANEWFRPFVILAFALLPVALSEWLVPKSSSKGNINTKVLFIGVSLNSKGIESNDNWNTWDPIRKSLKTNPDLREVILLLSSDIIKGNYDETKEENQRLDGLKRAIHKINPSIEIGEIIADVGSLDDVFQALKSKIESLKAKYRDEEMLFHVTSSTALVSVAMALHAIKGERKMEYIRQFTEAEKRKSAMPELIDVNIYTIRELWDEIIDKLSE